MLTNDYVSTALSYYHQLDQMVQGRISRLVTDLTTFPLDRFVGAAAVFLVFLLLRRPVRFVVLSLVGRLVEVADKSGADKGVRDSILQALHAPVGFLPVVIGAFFALEIIKIKEMGPLARLSDEIVSGLGIFAAYWVLFALIDPVVAQLQPKSSRLTDSVVDWICKALKCLVIFFALAACLEEWGVRVGPLLTSLGIVGAAAALGAQTLFKNLISGVLIVLEGRFQYGDWIKVNNVVEGTVESIGLHSTRVRQFDDASVQVPNADLADNAVINYTRMRRRRIYWVIGIPYSASVEQLKDIREAIGKYIEDSDEFVPAKTASTFVRVDSFGDSAINMMVYCFTRTTKWGEWLQVKEKLAYRVMDIISANGTSFAFPSTSLYVESLPEGERPDFFLPPQDGKPRIEAAIRETVPVAEPDPKA